MKVKELGVLPTNEIESKIRDRKEELFNLRFQKQLGKLENTARISQVRKEIARCKTILTERVLGMERSRPKS